MQRDGGSDALVELDGALADGIPVPVLDLVGRAAGDGLVVEDERHAAVGRDLAGELGVAVDRGVGRVGDEVVAVAQRVGPDGLGGVAGRGEAHRGARGALQQRVLVDVHEGGLDDVAVGVADLEALEVLVADDLAALDAVDLDVVVVVERLPHGVEAHDAVAGGVHVGGAECRGGHGPVDARLEQVAVVEVELGPVAHVGGGGPAGELVAVALDVGVDRQVHGVQRVDAAQGAAEGAVVAVEVVDGPAAVTQLEDDVLLVGVEVELEHRGAVAGDAGVVVEGGQVGREGEAR